MKTKLRVELMEDRTVPAAIPAAAHDAYAWNLVNLLRQNPTQFANGIQGLVDNTVTSALGYSATDPVVADLRSMIQFASVPANYSAALSLMRSTAGTGPLAWDEQLDSRAGLHNDWMRTHSFEHTGQDNATKYYLPGYNTGYSGGSPDVWGYTPGSYNSWGEDIGYGVGLASTSKANLTNGSITLAGFQQREAFLDTVAYMLEVNSGSLGHLKNLLGRDGGAVSGLPNFNSIGMDIDLYEGPSTYEVQDGIPEAYVSTHRLGFSDPSGNGGFIAGQVFNDGNGNSLYDIGEEVDATIDVRDSGGAGFTDTLVAGTNFGAFSGYVNNGTYTVTASINGVVVGTRSVTINNNNGSANFALNGLPDTTVTISTPSSTVTNLRPSVVWGSVTGAISYTIRIDNLTTKVSNFLPGTSVNATNWTPGIDLVSGQSYRVFVRAELSSSSGAWSTPVDLAIATPTLSGAIGTVSDLRPSFSWTAIDNASQYQVWLSDMTTNKINIFPNTLVSTTNWSPPADLVSGRNYCWFVKALNSSGQAVWSAPGRFTVGTPTLTGPSGTVADIRPTFSWGSVANATRYQVAMSDMTALKANIFGTVIVNGTSWTPAADLVSGRSYRWWVRAINDTGLGNWAPAGNFSIAPPTLVSLGSISDLRGDFSWTAVSNATQYQVAVSDMTSLKANIFGNTYVTGTSWTAPSDLVSGRNYRWWVRAVNATGLGNWSLAGNFSVATPTLVGPLGTAVTSQPSFSWTAVTGATQYQVWVNDSTTNKTNLFPNTLVPGTTWTPPADLVVGRTYRWWVRAMNSSGLGLWSTMGSFQV